ncbi:hypothetical protein PIB30_058693 [Stylosanthes scabra]|uniref:Retrotransposon gag domain-containing protein n=1 Tax=Stylosanthes scabra TaxID=79078 RepID=A0ABU6WM44_9FABA|nr:hypothetical protein [Stylosanthes scabra]
MAESGNTHSGENRPPRRRSSTPRNLNLNLGTPQVRMGTMKGHMEQQNLGVGGGGTPAQGNFFTPPHWKYLRVFRNHYELKIRELPKSLIGWAFTWYAKLRANSINTWEQIVMEFRNKFLEEEPSMHIMDLGRVKQRQGE